MPPVEEKNEEENSIWKKLAAYARTLKGTKKVVTLA